MVSGTKSDIEVLCCIIRKLKLIQSVRGQLTTEVKDLIDQSIAVRDAQIVKLVG